MSASPRQAARSARRVAAVVVALRDRRHPAPPDAKKAIEDIAQALGPWTYVLVGLLAFLETGAFVGLVAPGETTVIVGGVIAGQGEIELIPLIGLVWVCCVLGDTTSFFIGRRLGRDFLLSHGPRFKIDEKRLHQVESYFQRHGGKTILIGRFIGLVRALAPFVAGSSGLTYRRFLPFSVIGCGLWATLFTVLGFVFYRSFDKVAGSRREGHVRLRRDGRGDRGRGLCRAPPAQGGGAPAAGGVDRPPGRAAGGRPAFRAVHPSGTGWSAPRGGWRRRRPSFLKERVTPGGLGLELTTRRGDRRGGRLRGRRSTRCSSPAGARPRRPTASCSTWPTTCATPWRWTSRRWSPTSGRSPPSRRSCSRRAWCWRSGAGSPSWRRWSPARC